MDVSVSVVKVGGSLVADAARLRAVLARLAEGAEGPAVIVPGGGPFAEAVRATQGALGFGDALAHRLALDAMGRMAEVFCELEPRLDIVRSVEAAAETASQGTSCLWDPVVLRAGHPGIAESWDVTSDSLALWLAAALPAERCVLIKSAPCPAGTDPAELARCGFVDEAFPRFAGAFAGEIVLRGSQGRIAISRAGEKHTSHSVPHPEVPRNGPEGALQGSHRPLEGSFEARLRLAPQDEGQSGIGGRPCRANAGNAAA